MDRDKVVLGLVSVVLLGALGVALTSKSIAEHCIPDVAPSEWTPWEEARIERLRSALAHDIGLGAFGTMIASMLGALLYAGAASHSRKPPKAPLSLAPLDEDKP